MAGVQDSRDPGAQGLEVRRPAGVLTPHSQEARPLGRCRSAQPWLLSPGPISSWHPAAAPLRDDMVGQWPSTCCPASCWCLPSTKGVAETSPVLPSLEAATCVPGILVGGSQSGTQKPSPPSLTWHSAPGLGWPGMGCWCLQWFLGAGWGVGVTGMCRLGSWMLVGGRVWRVCTAPRWWGPVWTSDLRVVGLRGRLPGLEEWCADGHSPGCFSRTSCPACPACSCAEDILLGGRHPGPSSRGHPCSSALRSDPDRTAPGGAACRGKPCRQGPVPQFPGADSSLWSLGSHVGMAAAPHCCALSVLGSSLTERASSGPAEALDYPGDRC